MLVLFFGVVVGVVVGGEYCSSENSEVGSSESGLELYVKCELFIIYDGYIQQYLMICTLRLDSRRSLPLSLSLSLLLLLCLIYSRTRQSFSPLYSI